MHISVKKFWLIASLVAVTFMLPTDASARGKGRFGVGMGGMFNLSSTTNELADGQSLDNDTLFLRFSPRAEYFALDTVPITLRMGFLTRSLDRGAATSTEFDGIFTVGTGYHLHANRKFTIIFETEVGAYLGQSSREIEVGDQIIDESTDTKGVAIGGGLNFAYMLGNNSQLRAGVDYSGLFGSEDVPSSEESLDVTTHNLGLSLGFMYFF